MICGLAGFILLIAETDTLTILLLSKAIAAGLLYLSYRGIKSADKRNLEKIKRMFE